MSQFVCLTSEAGAHAHMKKRAHAGRWWSGYNVTKRFGQDDMMADAARHIPRDAAPPFAAPYALPDEDIAARLLAAAAREPAAEQRIDAQATRLVQAIRANVGALGGIEDFLREYSLSTKEGLALMILAEALLRVPDPFTADRLIEDKLGAADWAHHEPKKSAALLVSASAWALGVSARIIQPGETPENILESLGKRLGLPTVRAATRQAMRLLGSHFVLGQTIGEALERASAHRERRYSFDMLGEGARTAEDAERYFWAYADAIDAIGHAAGKAAGADRPGISVQLSALHPRYEAVSRGRVLAELTPRVVELARKAKAHALNFTIDAEEADRLELSLDVVGQVLADPALAGWEGFGLAVQAYQKRAYWDSEIKRAQERGLPDYPVFTRKAMTDICYMACVCKLLAARRHIYPQFATHNALTVASVVEEAGGVSGYEFQRLHGMGETLYDALLAEAPAAACRVYAPVGGHRDLLAYLVRRLLENGANSSFVSVAADPSVPIADILRRPQHSIRDPRHARHPKIPLPRDLYAPARRNSAGVEFGDRASLEALLREVRDAAPRNPEAAPIIDGAAVAGPKRRVISPIDGSTVGQVIDGDADVAARAVTAALAGHVAWAATPVDDRAAALDRTADALERDRGRLIALLQGEGGKTLDDSLAEVREAVDFCRYYAAEARRALAPEAMPGPTGESNELTYRGRGVFVCISPWNFPLAIFLGQVSAALVAADAVRLMHQAGVPKTVLHLVPGDGRSGAALTADARIAGVAFTGSTEVARAINRTLAGKDGPIVPLIAETGGVNAMVVDATALPEQVTDDVVVSAFRSAGQRCSALRLLSVQEDVADRVVAMIEGAARELKLGDPRDPATHVGPVIDAEAKQRLDGWIAANAPRVRFRWDRGRPLPQPGTYAPPTIIALTRAADLKEEVFGPILHVARFKADALASLLDDIAGTGYGLTLGVHSRIDTTVEQVVARLNNGNVYVNRSIIGAVVGTQPFGGTGLSGTGPKAGGPNYLRRFATEQLVTINTAAAGGNATLLTEPE